MALRDIVGQDGAIAILRGCIKRDRLPHALLFAGDEGVGKRLTAFNLAKVLNCHSITMPSSQSDAPVDCCDKCPSCIKIDKATHPDVFLIEPEGEGRQITISSIRRLQESLSYRPFEGRWKVAIVDNAEALNQSAANAFLETLEEPPPQSIIILISSRAGMLLSTIRSRCQRINFSPLPISTMGALVAHKFKHLNEEQTMLLSTLSGGRIGYALCEDLIEQRDRSFDQFRAMLGDPGRDLWEDRTAMESWFEWSQLWLRDIAVFRATGRADLLINQDKADEIKAISQQVGLKDILKLARELYNIREHLRFNLNRQITLYYTSLLLRKIFGRSNVRGQ